MTVRDLVQAVLMSSIVLACGGSPAPSPSLTPNASPGPTGTGSSEEPQGSASPAATTLPAARGYHALIDVPGDMGVLLISGSARPPANFYADTWAFSPSMGWSNLDPDPVIEVTDHAAYVASSGRVYAGVGETWLFDPEASTWQKLEISGPPFEPGSRSAYDSGSDRIVLYSADGSTWALDVQAEAWRRMAPSVAPPARGWSAMAYDVEADRVVLFGGVGAGDMHLADTWTYDLDTDTWRELETGTAPAGRTFGAMTYDPVGKRMLLFGGANGEWEAETVLDDTWSFDAMTSAWAQLDPPAAPSARAWHAIAFDDQSGLVILFGGGPHRRQYTAETWLFDPAANAWREWQPS